jgi:Type II CAAX prenyl endopeptidase Rce1-like
MAASHRPVVIILASTLIFAAIHLITNRANFYQILSWLISGAIFAYAYLVSGSIWVPIVIHFATDLTNVFVFNIVGQLSLFTITPAPTLRQRALVRVVFAILLVATKLHQSLDAKSKFRFVNVAEWESPQYFQAALRSEAFQQIKPKNALGRVPRIVQCSC